MISSRAIHNPTLKCLFRRMTLSNSDLQQIKSNYHCVTAQLPNKLIEHDLIHQTTRPIRSVTLDRTISTTTTRTMSEEPSSSGNQQQGKQLNRLSLERSPYLQQHATNPVDWYPWGQEAFDRAKSENKLIFLSVGYSTCHWCHVMEKESFENPEIAKIMNHYFINVKVDREERPDVDKLYMSFIQATVGGGGWPMSVFLRPTLEPLTGGTYFPPEDRYGRPGFKTVLINIGEQWKKQYKTMENSGKRTMEALRQLVDGVKTTDHHVPGDEVWKKCLLQLSHSYEQEFGGFSPQPKFPQPSNFNFLFHVYSRDKQSEQGKQCLEMCLNTLDRMAYGGIHDHVNCGFARYSVDNKWHVPHFEKMLYDQAQLAVSYADAYVLTKNPFYSEILEDILTYVSRDLSHDLGGFYGAEDADSYPFEGAAHKQEGAFCVWEYNELANLLDFNYNDKFNYFDLFKYHFDVRENGNVDPRHDPHQELKNKNVLACFGTYEQTAEKFQITVDEVKVILKKCYTILYEVRQKRPKPHVDTKIVTSWNGLMISGYAKGGFVLKQQNYIDRAILAANFIKKYLYNSDTKTLLRCCYKGDNNEIVQTATPIVGFLDDYAFLIRGLLDLYEASLDADWLSWAETLQEQQDLLFWDKKNYGYFTSPEGDSSILIRGKEDQDGAEPCGNSVSVHNLIRLAAYLDRQDLRLKAGQILGVFSERLKTVPVALPEMASALLFYHNTPTQVFIVGESEDNNTQALLDVIRSRYIPGRILAVADGPSGRAGLLYRRHETLNRLRPIQGKSAAYVCRNFACLLPVTEPDQLADSLDSNEHK